jgi:tetratricopeptide (TPR) repeat protein
MSDYKTILLELNNNLNILRQREAKYGSNAPLDLLNQIADHQKAIALTEQAIAGEITEKEWEQETATLLAFSSGQVVQVEIEADTLIVGDQHIHLASEEPPFWRRLSRANLILAIVLGLIATVAAVLAVPGVSDVVYGVFAPAPFRSAQDDETLIVIATFHETSVTHTEPHVKIKRAIEEAAQEVGLASLRVEIDPTELTADQREEAEALGKQYKASMVIWGEDTGVQVLVNFLNLKEPDFEAAYVEIDETEFTQITNPSAYASFITSDLPAQLTFLSLFAVGQTYYIQAEYPAAIRVIEKAVGSLPSEIPLLDGIAEAYFRLGWLYNVSFSDLESAALNYSKAIDLNLAYAAAYVNRGLTYANLGQYETALADYNKAIDLNPAYAVAYYNRGLTYASLGQYEAALADYNRAIDLNPELAEAYNNRGLTYDDLGQYEAALADYNKAIDLSPEFAVAYNNRGATYNNLGQYEAALADFSKAIDLNSAFAVAYYNRGLTYANLGQYEAALADFSKAIDLNPELAEAYLNRGVTYYNLGQYETALADYSKAIDLNPAYAEAYNNRGFTYANLGQYEVALANYNKAIDLNPELAEAYNNRGLTYANLGQYEVALADYNKAVDLNPAYAEVYNNRGLTYANLGQYEVALADYNKAIDLNPAYAKAYVNRGLTYANLGQYETALADFEQALAIFEKQLGPDHPNTKMAQENIAKIREAMDK